MPYTDDEGGAIRGGCTRFLAYHYPKPVSQRMLEIAESEYAKRWQDSYGRGGFLAEFEHEIAGLLGKEAAVFMPSGTMAQQIALRIWCDRAANPHVAFHPTCHLEMHEEMAYKTLHGLDSVLVGEAHRLMEPSDLEAIHQKVAVLLLELPQREIGGRLPSWENLEATAEWARTNGVRLHMDGARLWECGPFYRQSYAEICSRFDTVYVSFYKLLLGLPGAALAGPADVIAEARIWQRRHGGNLQQQSANAISAKLGMDEHLPKVGQYFLKARELGAAFARIPGVSVAPDPPQTPMMHLYISGDGERLSDAALAVARESRVLLVDYLAPTDRPDLWKLELPVGNATMDVGTEEAANLLEKVVTLASGPTPSTP